MLEEGGVYASGGLAHVHKSAAKKSQVNLP